MTLDTIKNGRTAVVLQVGRENLLRKRLLDMGFVPGRMLQVRKTVPNSNVIIVSLQGYSVALRRKDVQNIFVREV